MGSGLDALVGRCRYRFASDMRPRRDESCSLKVTKSCDTYMAIVCKVEVLPVPAALEVDLSSEAIGALRSPHPRLFSERGAIV